DLPIDRGIRELVGRFRDGRGVFVAQHVAQAGRIVVTELSVLMEDTDFWIWILLENVSRVKTRGQSIAREYAGDRVGRRLVIAPAIGAARDEQLRNFSLVEIVRDRELSGRPNRTIGKGDVLHFDELARLVAGSPRQEAVVGTDQVDLATIDAALIVDHLHVGLLGQTERREPGARTGIRHGLADLDLSIGHPRRVLRCRRHRHGAAREEAGEQNPKYCAPPFATSGHAAAAPPRRLMKSRGFIASPRRRSERRVRKGRCPNHSGVPLAFAHETVLGGAVEFLALRATRLRRARLPFTFFQEAVESGAGQWLAILVDCFARARFLRHCRADRQGRNHGSEDNSLHGTSSRWWTSSRWSTRRL